MVTVQRAVRHFYPKGVIFIGTCDTRLAIQCIIFTELY
jgi:hypothetical protein